MKVLMFGWEFPPHISGGLGTACYGLTQSLANEQVDILFVVPKIFGDEQGKNFQLISASNVTVPLEGSFSAPRSKRNQKEEKKILTIPVQSLLYPYSWQTTGKSTGTSHLEQWNYSFSQERVPYRGKQEGRRYSFTGSYGADLLEEVKRYAEVAKEISKQHSFDVIHAHDWLTFSAGIEAKKISGKPLIVHVHATEIDRAGENIDQRVFAIEREGMEKADKIIVVSNWTKKIVIERYGISKEKIIVIHNGVIPKPVLKKHLSLPPINKPIVTFLGRITHQKGPQYFIEAARLVSEQIKDVHFIMVGAGDMLPKMIERTAQLHMSSQFHFTGFLKDGEVDRIWKMTNVYVMPSVSEPFGISPLEAIQAGVPVIISNQSGVAEVIKNAVKVDFWNTKALAKAIVSILKNKKLSGNLKAGSKKEIKKVNWMHAAKKVNAVYDTLVEDE
jgi:glycogen synthase